MPHYFSSSLQNGSGSRLEIERASELALSFLGILLLLLPLLDALPEDVQLLLQN